MVEMANKERGLDGETNINLNSNGVHSECEPECWTKIGPQRSRYRSRVAVEAGFNGDPLVHVLP